MKRGHLRGSPALRLRAGDLGARADIAPSAGEFAALADDFNAMASALEARTFTPIRFLTFDHDLHAAASAMLGAEETP